MTQVLIDRATLEQLVEAAEGLMEWQVKNVKVWHNSAYDTMDMRLNQLRATIANAEPADTDDALMREALYALEYAADMTKPEGLSGCDCPICTSTIALQKRLGEKI